MKPAWLRCETCLWWEFYENNTRYTMAGDEAIKSVGLCHLDLFPIKPYSDSDNYCSHWTCANCWSAYDAYKDRDTSTDDEIYVDHSKCKEVRFK